MTEQLTTALRSAKHSYYKTKKQAKTDLERVHLREQLVITEKPLSGVRVVTLRHLADYTAIVTAYIHDYGFASMRCLPAALNRHLINCWKLSGGGALLARNAPG